MSDRFKFRVWWNSPYVNEESKYLYYNQNKFCNTTDIVRDASCDSVEDIVYYDIRDIILGDIDEFEKPNTFIVEQCTGLSDKNGKLIYEGDIVKCGNTTGVIKFGFYRKTDEHFPDSIYGFYIEWEKQCRFRQDFGYWITDERIEIIGNIHENKGE